MENMKEVIIELCHKIKNANHCNTCGGNHTNGICNYCGKENQQLIYLSLQLEKELNKLPTNFFEKDKLDDCLTALYLIRNMEIPIVTKTLTEYDYDNKIIKTCNGFFNTCSFIIEENIALSQEINHLLLKLLLNNEFNQNYELSVSGYLIKLYLEENNKFNISNSDKEKIALKATETIATNVLGFKKVDIKIQDDYFKDKEDTLGIQSFNSIYLSRQVIHGNPKELFTIIFHELIHLKQYKEWEFDNILSTKNLIQIKDKVLSNISKAYYKRNYKNISFEKEAYLYEYKEAIDYFNGLGVQIPEEFYKIVTLYNTLYSDFIENEMRMNENGETCNIEELFEEVIVSHPEYLERYPQLSFEYKVTDGKVVPKTPEDIEEDHQNFRDGILKWNGNQDEINNIYLNKINELKQNKGIK